MDLFQCFIKHFACSVVFNRFSFKICSCYVAQIIFILVSSKFPYTLIQQILYEKVGHRFIGNITVKILAGFSFVSILSGLASTLTEQCIAFFFWISGKWNILGKTPEKKKHKFLGITMMTLTPVVIKDLKERNPEFPPVDHGVLVWRVMVGSPSYE